MDAERFLHIVSGTLRLIGEAIRHGGPSATEAQIRERLSICEACPNFTGKHCPLCGCKCNGGESFLNKLAWASSECPDSPPRWGRITPE